MLRLPASDPLTGGVARQIHAGVVLISLGRHIFPLAPWWNKRRNTVQLAAQPSRTRLTREMQLTVRTLPRMAFPPEPAWETPSASDPDSFNVDDIYPELTAEVDSFYSDLANWKAAREDDVALFSILASGIGANWQRRVREAQQRGETLPVRNEQRPREHPH